MASASCTSPRCLVRDKGMHHGVGARIGNVQGLVNERMDCKGSG